MTESDGFSFSLFFFWLRKVMVIHSVFNSFWTMIFCLSYSMFSINISLYCTMMMIGNGSPHLKFSLIWREIHTKKFLHIVSHNLREIYMSTLYIKFEFSRYESLFLATLFRIWVLYIHYVHSFTYSLI